VITVVCKEIDTWVIQMMVLENWAVGEMGPGVKSYEVLGTTE
jgi:hypothetical protein